MKLQRKKRKLIKLKDAIEILGVSRTTLRNMIAAGELNKVQIKPGTCSPIRVYEAECIKIAESWGIFV